MIEYTLVGDGLYKTWIYRSTPEISSDSVVGRNRQPVCKVASAQNPMQEQEKSDKRIISLAGSS